MPLALRNRSPDLMHHVLMRTRNRELTLVNYREINELIGGILARYQEMLEIVIYSLCFNGNHFHLVLSAPKRNLETFMHYTNREISRRMRTVVPRSADESFWSGRYRDQIIATEEDLEEAFLYTSTNAVKHGLVSHMSEYPGLNSYEIQKQGGKRVFPFTHYSKKDENGRPLITYHTLTIQPLVRYERVNKEFQEYLMEQIAAREAHIAKARDFKPSLGRAFLLQRPFIQMEKPVGKQSRPTIYSRFKQVLLEWRIRERERRRRYNLLSRAYREGDSSIVFPDECYPPSRVKPPGQSIMKKAA